MGIRGWTRLALAGGLIGGLMVAAASTAQTVRRVDRPVAVRSDPVVVELFTAQGCGGCPEANQRVETLADRPGVIVLTYPVDYWDYTGWTDTLARPEFAERQQAYRQALRLRAVATPQVILDGYRTVAPPDEDTLGAAVDEAVDRDDGDGGLLGEDQAQAVVERRSRDLGAAGAHRRGARHGNRRQSRQKGRSESSLHVAGASAGVGSGSAGSRIPVVRFFSTSHVRATRCTSSAVTARTPGR